MYNTSITNTPTWTPGRSTYRMDVKTYLLAQALQDRTWGMDGGLQLAIVNGTATVAMAIVSILAG